MSILKKGWCPTLSRPMETGDGWLVRLHLQYGLLSGQHAIAIAGLALRYGNGHIDLTSRANVQLRGVQLEQYDVLAAEIAALGLSELPRPDKTNYSDYTPPLGYLPAAPESGTMGLGLAFGRMEASVLAWLGDAAARYGKGVICLSPWRAVYIPGVSCDDKDVMTNEAQAMGFILDHNDSRRAIHTCPGAPACSSAKGPTRELAMDIAKAFPNLVAQKKTVHVSGCAKGCACAAATSAVLVASGCEYNVAFDATAATAPAYAGLGREAALEKMKEYV